jgi:hypothetical protein
MEFVVIAQYTVRPGEEEQVASAHFTTWLKGEVLPRLAERTRLDLVPLASLSMPEPNAKASPCDLRNGVEN